MNDIEQIKKITQEKVIQFIKGNPRLYTKYDAQRIISIVESGTIPDVYSEELAREVLDELGLIPDRYNIYIDFLKLIEEIYGIEDKNILEVGGGCLPRLASRINLEQTKGTITVYDPRLSLEYSNEKLALKRQNVTIDTDVKGIDLIIGLMPCKGAEALIRLATKNNKDFIVWLCEGGPHGDYFDFYEDEHEWRESIILEAENQVKKQNMGILKQKTISKYPHNYPIIYNKRKED